MKRFNFQNFITRTNLDWAYSNRKTIRPFPGMYPTRWAISVKRTGFPEWKYVGKPNRTVAEFVYRVMNSAGRHTVLAYEFDADSPIAYASSTLTGQARLPVSNWNQPLYKLYYYWDGADGVEMITNWRAMSFPLGRLPIKIGDKIFRVYAGLEPTPGELRSFKTWFAKQSFKFSQSLTSTKSPRTQTLSTAGLDAPSVLAELP